MKEITMFNGMVALLDDSDFEAASKFHWYPHRDGKTYYAYAHTPKRDGRDSVIKLHRLLTSAPPNVLVDHRDGNGLNCQRYNMRFSNQSQNQQNRGVPKNNTSGYKGVCWDKRKRKWLSQIKAGIRIK